MSENQRVEISEETLESVNGGTITNVYSGSKKLGRVSSDVTGTTFYYTDEHCGDVFNYIEGAGRGLPDAEALAYMDSQGWLLKKRPE